MKPRNFHLSQDEGAPNDFPGVVKQLAVSLHEIKAAFENEATHATVMTRRK
jgi:hypothetical protein